MFAKKLNYCNKHEDIGSSRELKAYINENIQASQEVIDFIGYTPPTVSYIQRPIRACSISPIDFEDGGDGVSGGALEG